MARGNPSPDTRGLQRGGYRKARRPQHEKFCQLIAAGMSTKDAYREAGMGTNNELSNRHCSTRLRRILADRISEIMGIKFEVTTTVEGALELFQKDVPKLHAKLWGIINDNKAPHGARILAIRECLNRALGLPVQLTETHLNVRYEISDRELTIDEWDAKYIKPLTLGPPSATEH
jgi:hypothetical protein